MHSGKGGGNCGVQFFWRRKAMFGVDVEGLRRLFEYVSARPRMVQHIYSAMGHAALEEYLMETTRDLFMAYLRDAAEGLNPSEEDLEFLCFSYQFMLLGWLRRGMKGELAELLERAQRLFFHGTRRILEENSVPPS